MQRPIKALSIGISDPCDPFGVFVLPLHQSRKRLLAFPVQGISQRETLGALHLEGTVDSNAGTAAFYMQQDLAAPIIDHAVAEAVSGPQIAHAVYDNGSRIRIVRRIADVAGTDMQGSEANRIRG